MVNDFKKAHSLLKKQEAYIEGQKKWKVLKEKLEENPTAVMKKNARVQILRKGVGAFVHLLSTWTNMGGGMWTVSQTTKTSQGYE